MNPSTPERMPRAPTQVFLSYARADSGLRDRLTTILEPMRRAGLITIWHDQQLAPGDDWRLAIDAKLEEADIILLLVSPEFLASDYCSEVELAKALDRWSRKKARVVPIIARNCLWEHSPLKRAQAILVDDKPVASVHNQDDAWAQVGRRIERLVAVSQPTQTARGSATDGLPPGPRHASSTLRWKAIALVGIPSAATTSALITLALTGAGTSAAGLDTKPTAFPQSTIPTATDLATTATATQHASTAASLPSLGAAVGIWVVEQHKSIPWEVGTIDRQFSSTLTIQLDGLRLKATLAERTVDEAPQGETFACTGTRRSVETYRGLWTGILEGDMLVFTNVSYVLEDDSRSCNYRPPKELKFRMEKDKLAGVTIDGMHGDITKDYIFTRVEH